MLPIPTYLQGVFDLYEESYENKIKGRLKCECDCDSFMIEFFGEKGEETLQSSALEDSYYIVAKAVCSKCGQKKMIFCNQIHGWDGFVCNKANHKSIIEKIAQLDFDIQKCKVCNKMLFKINLTILSQGKQDFINELSEEIDKGIFSESDWVDAFEWIIVDLICVTCGDISHFIDYETM